MARRALPGLPDFGDDWQDVAGCAIGLGLDRGDRRLLRRLNVGIAKLNARRLRRRKRRLRAPGDHHLAWRNTL